MEPNFWEHPTYTAAQFQDLRERLLSKLSYYKKNPDHWHAVPVQEDITLSLRLIPFDKIPIYINRGDKLYNLKRFLRQLRKSNNNEISLETLSGLSYEETLAAMDEIRPGNGKIFRKSPLNDIDEQLQIILQWRLDLGF